MSCLFFSPDGSRDHSPTSDSAQTTAFSIHPSLVFDTAQESHLAPAQNSFLPLACVENSLSLDDSEAEQPFQNLPTNFANGLSTFSNAGLVPSTTTYCENDVNANQTELPRKTTRARSAAKSRRSAPQTCRQRPQKKKLNGKANRPETSQTTGSETVPGGAQHLGRKKWIGIPVPKSFAEATEPDVMMWQWKNAGRSWKEIRAEWQRLTGHYPADSTLSVRYMKLNDMMANQGAATDVKLCEFKKEAEEELNSELWARVAAKMIAYHPHSEHNPKSLKMRYDNLVRSGFHKKQLQVEDTEAVSGATGTPTGSFNMNTGEARRHDWTDNTIATPDVPMLDPDSRLSLQRIAEGSLPFSLLHQFQPDDQVAELSQLSVAAMPLVNYDSDE